VEGFSFTPMDTIQIPSNPCKDGIIGESDEEVLIMAD
jgi:hypothetical protein